MKKPSLITATLILLAILGFVFMPKEAVQKEVALQSILNKTVDAKKVFGTSFAIKKGDFYWEGQAGNFEQDQPYFIASVTKLYTSAMIFQLQAEGALALDDKISKYLDAGILDGLHVYEGKEYSYDLTIRQLLSHTSGLPDYFQGVGSDGSKLDEELFEGKDRFWSFEEMISRTKSMSPHFAPDEPGEALYSDTNYQLLGKIIEAITRQSYIEATEERIFKLLGLTQTYVYADTLDEGPRLVYHKTKQLHIPKIMTSFGPDGAIVSTSRELLRFTEAFFKGELFPAEYLQELQQWNAIFYPFENGTGIQRMNLPWIFNPTGSMPELMGHVGLSGVVAFYSPEEDLFIVGTVNQLAHQSLSVQTTLKLVNKAMEP